MFNCILGNQKPSSENRTLDVHVDDSELIACLEEVEGKAGKGKDSMSITIHVLLFQKICYKNERLFILSVNISKA